MRACSAGAAIKKAGSGLQRPGRGLGRSGGQEAPLAGLVQGQGPSESPIARFPSTLI